MVRLRLRRIGKKKQPMYKIVAADSRAARNGRFLEAVGLYNPLKKPHVVEVNEKKVFKWLKRGAVPTDTVRSLFQRKGVWLKWSLLRKGADEATIASTLERWEMMQSEKLTREAVKKDRRRAAHKAKAAKTEGSSGPTAQAATPAGERTPAESPAA